MGFGLFYLAYSKLVLFLLLFILSLLMIYVTGGVFSEISCGFLVAGHTKFSPDTMFGWLSGRLKNRDYFEVQDVQDLANETPSSLSYTTLILSREKMRNWKSFLDPHIKAVHGITKYHHFKVQKSDGDPTVHAKAWSSDGSWKQLNVLRKPFTEQKFPPLLPFKRLSPEKLNDLQNLAQLTPQRFLTYATQTPPGWEPWGPPPIQ